MLARELRQKYIEFFQSKDHLHLPGAPLIPYDALGNLDTSTLFTSAGMQQFKPYFVGAATPPHPRIVTVQKCLRTGDIDSVGDFSHCTFFEMLGNFSFGDYFKAEVIAWTWEFLTQWLKLDPERLCVTVYQDDAETFDIWHKDIGLPKDRIHRLGEDKNYWPANAISDGPDGPCGPCTEIFYRVAPLEEMTADPSLTPTERYLLDDRAGRWLEIWNNVFTQFNRSEDANGKPLLTPLPKKNNDTGAGFDRLAYVVQGKQSVFETDLFQPTLTQIETLCGLPYGGAMSPTDFAFRVVAEHTRSMVFCIADGILPDKEKAGYVLRYIIRRAVRYGKTALGFDAPFLHLVAPKVIEQMGDFYPELRERRELILRTIQDEEERFRRTLDNGMSLLVKLLDSPEVSHAKLLPGGKGGAFTLYETYGFPIKLTQELAAERGIEVDMAAFDMAMEEHRARGGGGEREVFGDFSRAIAETQRQHPPTEFVGYDRTAIEATVLAIIKNGERIEIAEAGPEPVEVILDRTPFYAEAGGQVGDTGWFRFIESRAKFQVRVVDTRKVGGYSVHLVNIDDDVLRVGQPVHAEVDVERRNAIRRSHTATHLLHAALRSVLGEHAHQKGSLVAPDRLRFDFTHTQPMTAEELSRVEAIVVAEALKDDPVVVHENVPLAEAKARGAMALFGEKYGDRVRMIEIPGYSLELCGGTHLSHTAQVGLFKIVSETGVAAGVRRIEAVTGAGAYAYVNEQEARLQQAAGLLKARPNDLVAAVERLIAHRQELERQNRQLKTKATAGPEAELTPLDVHGVPVVIHAANGSDAETIAALADRTAQRLGSVVVVIGAVHEGKVAFAAKVTRDLVAQGLHAGNLVREVAKLAGGGGGGRPDFAQAGGRDPNKLQAALEAVPQLVSAQMAAK